MGWRRFELIYIHPHVFVLQIGRTPPTQTESRAESLVMGSDQRVVGQHSHTPATLINNMSKDDSMHRSVRILLASHISTRKIRSTTPCRISWSRSIFQYPVKNIPETFRDFGALQVFQNVSHLCQHSANLVQKRTTVTACLDNSEAYVDVLALHMTCANPLSSVSSCLVCPSPRASHD